MHPHALVSFRKLHQDAHAPDQATIGSTGYDLRNVFPVMLNADGGRSLVPTGIEIDLPNGFGAEIRPRSGLALKHGVTVLNAPGTIDNDYTSELKVLLINHGDEAVMFEPGSRIAQLVIVPVIRASFSDTMEFVTTGRGGFGSTGVM